MHDQGDPYTALIIKEGEVHAFLEINMGLQFVGSSFLDEHLREHVTYSFQGQEEREGELFLSTATHWEYPDDSDSVEDSDEFIKSMRYIFEVDGKVFMEEIDTIEEFKETSEAVFDSNKNWEAIPEFGYYEAFLKVER